MKILRIGRRNGRASLKWVSSQEAAGPLTEEDFNRAVVRMLQPYKDPTPTPKASPGATSLAKDAGIL